MLPKLRIDYKSSLFQDEIEELSRNTFWQYQNEPLIPLFRCSVYLQWELKFAVYDK